MEQGHAAVELAKRVSRKPDCAEDSFMVTCKSDKKDRIIDNTSIFNFSLTSEQMKKLDDLECAFKVTPSTKPTPEERRRYYEDMP